MGMKIAFSGLVLSVLLLLPAVLKDVNPPFWFKAIVVIVGCSGLIMVFAGLLVAIWE